VIQSDFDNAAWHAHASSTRHSSKKSDAKWLTKASSSTIWSHKPTKSCVLKVSASKRPARARGVACVAFLLRLVNEALIFVSLDSNRPVQF
jgi:hypothetical protein